MAIKEYRVPQANFRPIYKKPVRLPRDFVQPSKAAAKETPEVPLAKGQAPIAAQGRSPRYDAGSLMGLVSSLRSPGEANPAFDSSKPIGGENVPYKGTSGIGGVFSRIFGNRANELNVEAQQQQAAEMRDKALREEERAAKREDLAEEIRLRTEAERGLKKEDREFTASQTKAARDFQAAESALDRALKLSEGTANRDATIAEARANRDAARERLTTELAFRGEEGERERTFRGKEGRAERRLRREASKPPGFTRLGDNVFADREGNVMEYTPGTPSYGKQKGTRGMLRKLMQPGTAPAREEGEGDVNPATGQPISAAGQLPPGGGVIAPGRTAPTMGAAEPTSQPRYATLSDRLLTLPGMGAIFDMPRIMTPERTARLAESRSLQEAENRERIRRMQEEAGQDLGPSMF